MTDDQAGEEELAFQNSCISSFGLADLLHRQLAPVLGSSAAAANAYSFKGRVKPWWSVRDKVLRKQNDGDPGYGVERVKDISGFRIVTLFNADIPHRLDLLLSLVAAGNGVFSSGLSAVQEIEIHSNRRKDDPQAITDRVKAIVERWKERGPLPEPKSEGSFSAYSSVHVVLQFPASAEIPRLTKSEIQIRSVFEEAWSEISHKLGYGPDKLAASQSPVADRKVAPVLWKQHLNALKSLVDGCAHYSDLIAQEGGWKPGESPLPPPGPRSIFPTVGGSLAFYADLPHSALEELKTAFDLLDKAEQLRSPEGRSLPAAGPAFKEAGTKFSEVLSHLSNSGSVTNPRRQAEVLNGVRAEIAYCFMHALEPELIAEAERLWREVIHVEPEFVPAYHRLGTLLMRKAEYQEAGQLLESAERLALQQLSAANEEPLQQRLLLIRRDLGINYWRLSERSDVPNAKADLLGKAVDASILALDHGADDRQVKTLSANALYCLAELRWLNIGWDTKKDAQARVTLNRLRGVAEYGTWARESGWSDFALDSVMRGEAAFGDSGTARAVARELLRRLNVKVDELIAGGINPGSALGALDADDQDIYHIASRIAANTDV